MIVLNIKFSCKFCGQHEEWYAMPTDTVTPGNEVVQSLTDYILRCKKCGQKYLLSYNIKVM